MSRLRSLLLLAPILAGLAQPHVLHAQRVESVQRLAVATRPLTLVVADADESRYAVRMTPISPAPRAAQAEDGKSSALGTVVRAAGGIGAGAQFGGWLGYFSAQVGRSDWDRVPTSEKTSLRQNYMVAGLGVGGLLGYFARPRPHAPNRLPQPFNIPARTGRQLLANAELRRSIATNALEAVELGRPEWIKPQHDDEAKQGAAPRAGPVEFISLVVYVGEERIGGIETLREIAIPEVTELRFYDPRDARRRWGVEHRYGAIEVVPVGTASTSAASPAPEPVPTTSK